MSESSTLRVWDHPKSHLCYFRPLLKNSAVFKAHDHPAGKAERAKGIAAHLHNAYRDKYYLSLLHPQKATIARGLEAKLDSLSQKPTAS